MSFVDYGLKIFPRRDNVLHSCGDSNNNQPHPDCCRHSYGDAGSLEHSCYHVIVDHLIELGTCAENELTAVKRELERFKQLELTKEQVDQLQSSDVEKDSAERFVRQTRFEDSRAYVAEYLNEKFGTSSRDSNDAENSSCPCKNDYCCTSVPRRGRFGEGMRDSSFRSTIIQKDSEIISLKNENAAKETELKEREEQAQKLESVIDEMTDKIDELESNLRISQAQVQDAMLQKNEDIVILEKNIEKLERELRDVQQTRKLEAKEMQSLLDELRTSKQRVTAIEESKANQEVMVKQLKLERDNLDKRNREQEDEIDKFINIIKRLDKKCTESQAELSSSRQELDAKDLKLSQCRDQLEVMEREVSQLISELSDCLRRVGSSEASLEPDDGDNLWAQARHLSRGLDRVLSEHDRCREYRSMLQQENKRLHAINRARITRQLLPVRVEASRELVRLKKLVLGAANFQSIKADFQHMFNDLLVQLDNRKLEKFEHAYLGVASEASLALERLNKTISDQEVYRKFENLFLLALEGLQEALDNAEKTINSLDRNMNKSKIDAISDECDEKLENIFKRKECPVQSTLSEKILYRVKYSTKIVLRITAALQDESESNMSYKKELENQLKEVVSANDQLNAENYELRSNYDESSKQCQELAAEIEKLKKTYDERTSEQQSFIDEMQARIDSYAKENELLRQKVRVIEKDLRNSRTENSTLVKKKNELLQQMKKKELEIAKYCKHIDELNAGQEKSNKMIEQLQNTVTIVQENMRKVNMDGFTALQNRILELVKEKKSLAKKIEALESQLASFERNNNKLQDDLVRIEDDNDYLEKCVKAFKAENQRLEENVAMRNFVKANLCSRCDNLIAKVNRFAKQSCDLVLASDTAADAREAEMNNLIEKLRYQQKELMMKEKELHDKSQQIEQLTSLVSKAKEENAVDSAASLAKRIEILNSEKAELKKELKQTSMKYEDKLAEMHKQYKHNELELHKNHNESISRLEAKYAEMLKEEGKIYGSQNWLQTLNSKQLQELHDRICKNTMCSRNLHEKDVYEEQRKKNELRSTVSNHSARRTPVAAAKKVAADARSVKSINLSKPSTRQRSSVKEILSSRSIVLPEKEYSHPVKTTPSSNKGK